MPFLSLLASINCFYGQYEKRGEDGEMKNAIGKFE